MITTAKWKRRGNGFYICSVFRRGGKACALVENRNARAERGESESRRKLRSLDVIDRPRRDMDCATVQASPQNRDCRIQTGIPTRWTNSYADSKVEVTKIPSAVGDSESVEKVGYTPAVPCQSAGEISIEELRTGGRERSKTEFGGSVDHPSSTSAATLVAGWFSSPDRSNRWGAR